MLYECAGCGQVSEDKGKCTLCGHGRKKALARPLRGRRKPRPPRK
jgi:hypothetical protein